MSNLLSSTEIHVSPASRIREDNKYYSDTCFTIVLRELGVKNCNKCKKKTKNRKVIVLVTVIFPVT
jgi:hypothetical protein